MGLQGLKQSDVVSENTHRYMFPFTLSDYVFWLVFNPFTVKVIVNMHDPITVFLIVGGLFSVGLFLLLYVLTREVPLTFVVKLAWWC